MNQQAATMRRTRRVQPRRRAARLRRVVALRDRVRALIAGSGSSMRDSVVDGKGTGGGDCRATFPQGPKPQGYQPVPFRTFAARLSVLSFATANDAPPFHDEAVKG